MRCWVWSHDPSCGNKRQFFGVAKSMNAMFLRYSHLLKTFHYLQKLKKMFPDASGIDTCRDMLSVRINGTPGSSIAVCVCIYVVKVCSLKYELRIRVSEVFAQPHFPFLASVNWCPSTQRVAVCCVRTVYYGTCRSADGWRADFKTGALADARACVGVAWAWAAHGGWVYFHVECLRIRVCVCLCASAYLCWQTNASVSRSFLKREKAPSHTERHTNCFRLLLFPCLQRKCEVRIV